MLYGVRFSSRKWTSDVALHAAAPGLFLASLRRSLSCEASVFVIGCQTGNELCRLISFCEKCSRLPVTCAVSPGERVKPPSMSFVSFVLMRTLVAKRKTR